MTTYYIVLHSLPRADGEAPCYELLGSAPANGPEQAIKAVRSGSFDTGAYEHSNAVRPVDVFHAVPVRNWTSVAANTKTPEPRTTFEKVAPPGQLDIESVADLTPDPPEAAA